MTFYAIVIIAAVAVAATAYMIAEWTTPLAAIRKAIERLRAKTS